MQRRLLLVTGTVLAASAISLALIGAQAPPPANATTGPDLAITGSVVSGVRTVEAGLGTHVAMAFKIKNKSASQSAEISFNFKFINTPDPGMEFYECPLVSTHFAINPDTPSCEPGVLGPGKSSGASVIVVPQAGTSSMSVRACAQNLTGPTDPVSSNNCKTLTVAVVP
jgi:hypothetical protein